MENWRECIKSGSMVSLFFLVRIENAVLLYFKGDRKHGIERETQ